MPIRMSGLMSNMDTDSLVQQLMAAQRTKLTKVENKQTKLTWSQDKWKELNTKIYKLYTDQVSKMRLQGSYNTMKTSSSNETAFSVTATTSAPAGSYNIAIDQLASAQMITGAKITATDGSSLKSTSKLSSLGIATGTKLTIKGVEFSVGDTTTIEDFTKACKDAGLNASFDTTNQRFFISSKGSGEANSFLITTAEVSAAKDDVYSMFGTPSDEVKKNIDSYLNDYANATTTLQKDAIITELSKLDGYSGDTSQLKNYANTYETTIESSNLNKLGIGSNATIIDAKDSIISYNGVKFQQATNTVSINGLTINAKEVTTSPVTVNVTKDTQATYDAVKNFIKEYNSILKEMNTLYYAGSSKGYEPLSDDEKESMTDDQIEKWETKIQDSLLRRDSTLGTLLTSMKSNMSSVIKDVPLKDGTKKNLSLSSFGIHTSSDYTEKGLLHIDGDKDDALYSTSPDKLMKALEEDPDSVVKTLSGIATNLYKTMTDKMKSSTLSSALTFYNDKAMTKQQTQYTKSISTLEDKLNDMENNYYKKFTAMETALAKLQESTSALSSMMNY